MEALDSGKRFLSGLQNTVSSVLSKVMKRLNAKLKPIIRKIKVSMGKLRFSMQLCNCEASGPKG